MSAPTPGWLAATLAVLLAATACYCAARLGVMWLRRLPGHQDAGVAAVAMAAVMAAGLAGTPNLPSSPLAVAFGGAMAWFGWQCVRAYVVDGPGVGSIAVHLRHGVLSAAMVAMLAASVVAPDRQAGAMAGMGAAPAAARLAAIAALAALAIVAARDCVRFVRGRPPDAEWVLGSPRLAVGCELAMTATMGYLLVAMR